MLNAVLLNVTVSNFVHSCDDDLLDLRIFREFVNIVLVAKIEPSLPFILVGEIDIVVDRASVHATR
jgi:hypothetical protein